MTERQQKEIRAAREVPIVSYLSEHGIPFKKSSGYYICSSPFSEDKNWSFTVFKDNRYYDFSNGRGGDIVTLVMQLERKRFWEAVRSLNNNVYEEIAPIEELPKRPTKPFKYSNYINHREDEKKLIDKYARSRGIYDGYDYGIFFTKDDNEWIRHPSILFPHVDLSGKIIGGKLRAIEGEPRFRAKGKLGYYILENIIENSFAEPVVYLVESETSANSLWEYLKSVAHSSVVISCGGVAAAPSALPDKYKDYQLKIIIDYDGDEELYSQRCEMYDGLRGEHIKVVLPKGEDLNSLWAKGKMNYVTSLII